MLRLRAPGPPPHTLGEINSTIMMIITPEVGVAVEEVVRLLIEAAVAQKKEWKPSLQNYVTFKRTFIWPQIKIEVTMKNSPVLNWPHPLDKINNSNNKPEVLLVKKVPHHLQQPPRSPPVSAGLRHRQRVSSRDKIAQNNAHQHRPSLHPWLVAHRRRWLLQFNRSALHQWPTLRSAHQQM